MKNVYIGSSPGCYRNHTTFPLLASLNKFSKIMLTTDRKKMFLRHFKIFTLAVERRTMII